ncbi:MAG: hypothetical protein UH081_03850, partial [Clostridia bacterium]|nr:hypothetical protein [Clostridia bacterium]
AKTLLKDDFSVYATGDLSTSEWKMFNDTANHSPVVDMADMKLVKVTNDFPTKQKLSEEIDYDKDNVYYASWVQSLNRFSGNSSETLKTGFLNINNASETKDAANSVFLWQGDDKTAYPNVKFSGSFSDSKLKYETISSSSDKVVEKDVLYNVLMKIETHETDNDKIEINFWRADQASPKLYKETVEQSKTGKCEYFGFFAGKNVEAYFGNLKVIKCSDENKTDAEAVYKAMKGLKFGEIPSKITKGTTSITLPVASTSNDAASVSYAPANEKLIEADGSVKTPGVDTMTSVKATISKGAISFELYMPLSIEGSAKTLLKDDFNYTDLKNTNWTKLNNMSNGQKIVKQAGINLIDFEYKVAAARKLDTPINMDSENVYYASWVQSLNEIAADSTKTLKTGFANIVDSKEDGNARTVLAWIGQGKDNVPTADYPTVKLSLQKNFSADISTSDSRINVGTLYNVLMRIEAHRDDTTDKIQVKYWPVGCAEPLNWNGEKSEIATGIREYFEVLPGSVEAYFGKLNVEVYENGDADELIDSVKNYVKSTDTTADAPNVDGNTAVIPDGVVYNSAKNMLKLKNSIYLKEVALLDKTDVYTRTVKTPLVGNNAVVKPVFANDTAASITGKKYLTAFVVYGADNAVEQIATYILNSEDVVAGSSYGKGLTINNISENASSYRVFVWDADTLAPVINDITLKNNMIINY